MKKRKLGKWGLEGRRVRAGCMGMSEFYGPGNQFESEATIDRAIDLGVTFLTRRIFTVHSPTRSSWAARCCRIGAMCR